MTETTEASNVPAAAVEQKKMKKVSTSAKKPAAKPNHPPTAQMVDAAIKTLKERGGSSLLAVKKYLAANYKVDADKLAPFIKKYLKSSVESGHLIQTKGKGASGSFKLSAAASKPKKEGKVNKTKVEKKSTKVAAKKSTADKKKKAATPKKSAKLATKAIKKVGVVKTKTPKQKSTKPSKIEAKKPKTGWCWLPKKATSSKKVASKKDADKLAPFIKKYLKSSVESGHLIQTKGKGASKIEAKKPKTGWCWLPKKTTSSKKVASKKA